jgi:hypothetical protein
MDISQKTTGAWFQAQRPRDVRTVPKSLYGEIGPTKSVCQSDGGFPLATIPPNQTPKTQTVPRSNLSIVYLNAERTLEFTIPRINPLDIL